MKQLFIWLKSLFTNKPLVNYKVTVLCKIIDQNQSVSVHVGANSQKEAEQLGRQRIMDEAKVEVLHTVTVKAEPHPTAPIKKV